MRKNTRLDRLFYRARYYGGRASAAALLLLAAASVQAQTMTDIGTNAPVPGLNDVSQLVQSATTKPDGLNYYTDNGQGNGLWAGQTFTTGSNPSGYILNSLALKSAGLDSGGGYNNSQPFQLYIYSVSGSTATLLTNFNATSSFTDGDWIQWSGLDVALTNGTTYAYGFGRTSAGSGWAALGVDGGNVYAGGQVALLPTAGGTITFGSSGNFDAAFDIGLTPIPLMTDIGTTAPVPGTNDLYQLQWNTANWTQDPAGLNYFSDNYAGHNAYGGQTFTTGTNAGGYALTSVSFLMAGLNDGGGYNASMPFNLAIFSINNGVATVLETYTVTSTFTDGDWIQWTGLEVPLSPSSTYAYGFGRTTAGAGWAGFANMPIALAPFSGGSVALITPGGAVQAATGYEAVFDLGLVPTAAEVILPPTLSATNEPQSEIVYAGGNATFSVVLTGGTKPVFQWKFNGNNLTDGGGISGSTNTTLTITGVAAANAGSYTVTATNASGSVSTLPATLTVLPAPAPNSYAGTVMSLHPQTYWRLNETNDPSTGTALTYDYAGGLVGSYGTNAVNGFDGVLGPVPPGFLGFEADNYTFESTNSDVGSVVTVPTAPLNTNTVTYTAWIYPDGWQVANGYTGIFMTRSTTQAGVGYTVNNELGFTWNQNAQGAWGYYSGLVIPTNEWSFIAVTISPTQGIIYLYNAQGLLAATNSLISAYDAEAWGGSAQIGEDPGFGAGTGGRVFNGKIDEVAVFKQTLSPSQILQLYAAGVAAGVLPPQISVAPQNNEMYAGRPATLGVQASGSGTVTYQWYSIVGGVTNAINGATSAELNLGALSAANAGEYFVVVGNQAGSITSSVATLSIALPTHSAYEAAITNSNPVGYWRLGEVAGSTYAYDYWNGNTGTYGTNAVEGLPGPQSPAFPGFEADNTGFQSTYLVNESWVSAPPIYLNTNTVTLLGWINSASPQAADAGIIFWRNGSSASGLMVSASGADLGYTWNNDATTYGYDSLLAIPQGQWAFVALVIDPVKATFYLGTGGVLQSAVNNYPNPVQTFGSGITFGNDDYDLEQGQAAGSRAFTGTIDEVAIYNRALTGGEIAALYSAASGIVVPPQITEAPQNTAAYAGGAAHFTVAAAGTALNYTWQFNGTNLTDGGIISGSTTPTLTLTGVTTNNAGPYTVVVNNSVGPAVSNTPPATLAVGVVNAEYESSILSYGPLAYWRFNEGAGSTTAYDYAGGFDGVYGADAVLGVPGPLPPAFVGFEAGNTGFNSVTNDPASFVTIPESLDNTSTNVTITAWIYPTVSQNGSAGIVFSRDSAGDAAGLCYGAPNVLGYTWDDNNSTTWSFNSGLVVPTNQWSFVALVVSETNSVLYLGNSGVLSFTNNPPPAGLPGLQAVNQSEKLDALSIGDDPGDTSGRVFTGTIDEVSIIPQALTTAQIQSLYQVGQSGSQTVGGIGLKIVKSAGAITVTWNYGTLLQAPSLGGPWTPVAGATSPYTPLATGGAMFYRVQL